MSGQAPRLLDSGGLGGLVEVLRSSGYKVIGPRVREGALVYDEISSIEDLPEGVGDEQEPGRHKLTEREDAARFGYVVPGHTWKKVLVPPGEVLWTAEKVDEGFVLEGPAEPEKVALFGVRPCELEAIKIQDRILGERTSTGAVKDPNYMARRENSLVVAVNCSEPAGTCFCTSMDTGPDARDGYDLCLTEMVDGDSVSYLAVAGSEQGGTILGEVQGQEAGEGVVRKAERVVSDAVGKITREMNTDGLAEDLEETYESPRYDDVEKRCLACGNCTLVCPTCFCASVEDVPSLGGATAARIRRWDSCFTSAHSYIHGGSIHQSIKSRYRQWLTHKLSSWHTQFGMSGCVGCGRCITWCPPGIDITVEAAEVRKARGN